MNPKKVATAIGALLLVLIAIAVYIALWTGSTKDIEAVADKFKPGKSWILISERIEPPRHLCLDGGTCPQLSRTWSMPQAITKNQFAEMLPTEYNAKVTGNCPETLPETSPTQASCHALGAVNEYVINVIYSLDLQLEHKYRLTINVRKEA